MCGVPFHAAEGYIARLLRAGYKIAVCDQMEAPTPGKKLVRREVVRVITPGTATSLNVLEPKENNYLAAIFRAAGGTPIGFAYADVTTGEFRAAAFSGEDADEKLRDELRRAGRRRDASLAAGVLWLSGLIWWALIVDYKWFGWVQMCAAIVLVIRNRSLKVGASRGKL